MIRERGRTVELLDGFQGVAYPAGASADRYYQGLPHDTAQVSPRTIPPEHFDQGYHPGSFSSPRIIEVEDDEDYVGIEQPARRPNPTVTNIAATPGLHTPAPPYPLPPPGAGGPAMAYTFLGVGYAGTGGGNSFEPGPYSRTEPAPQPVGVKHQIESGDESATDGSLIDVKPVLRDVISLSSGSSASLYPAASEAVSIDGTYIIRAVHDACLGATQRHLRALRTNWHVRTCSPYDDAHDRRRRGDGSLGGAYRSERTTASRFSPYARDVSSFSRHRNANNHGPARRRASSDPGRMAWSNTGDGLHGWQAANPEAQVGGAEELEEEEDWISRCRRRGGHPAVPIPEPTRSLLANAHAICGVAWRRAARDRLDVLGAERDALAAMTALVEWAERVALAAVTAEGEDGSGGRGGGVGGGEGKEAVEDLVREVLTAGTALCEWLRDEGALREIADVELEVGFP
ncbi:hypothetical protein NKR23_g7353 [Pleurostoma richardsiae]|uniref:Uncharacterized protein n=1 Tax=Pleurostoma richardsiae TaxID=41990 RepID=A0AA38RN47_9PEZI|nr:hypothetical protein NKR23_g7353 [Pleurostoma richardsiae]